MAVSFVSSYMTAFGMEYIYLTSVVKLSEGKILTIYSTCVLYIYVKSSLLSQMLTRCVCTARLDICVETTHFSRLIIPRCMLKLL